MKRIDYWKLAIIVQGILFLVPLVWCFFTVDMNLQIKQNFCTENYKQIFADSEKDLLNYERTNEDIIRQEEGRFNKCERALKYPGYWRFYEYFCAFIVSLLIQLISWTIWFGIYIFLEDIFSYE